MHVIIATGLYPPEIGGPATFSVLLEKGFGEHDISYTTLPFKIVRFLPKVLRHIAYFAHVFRAVRRDSIVLALDPVSVGLPALIAARIHGVPFYLRAGGDYAWEQAQQRWGFSGMPEDFPGTAKLPLAGKILVWTERYVARRAARILTQSGHLATIAAHWGVAKEKIAVVSNGATIPELPSREDVRRELGWGKGPVVVSAGRFVPWKGFAALMDAVASLKNTYPDIRLLIAGEGPDERKLKQRASALSTRVEFLGNLPKEKLIRIVRAADVFTLNTGYEGFSHQILESMAVGTPVVTTTIPGNKDLALDGKTALAIPFNNVPALADAIRRLLSDRELATRIGQAGEIHARSFTPERCFKGSCQALGISV